MRPILPLLALGLVGCPPVEPDTLDTSGPCAPPDTGPHRDTSDTSDTELEPCCTDVTLTGTVELALRSYDEQGDLVRVPWEDSCFGEVWPHGSILVAAWDGDTEAPSWMASDTIHDPAVDSSMNAFSIHVDDSGGRRIRVAAFLDKWFDNVVGTPDPVADFGTWIELPGDATTVVDIDVVIDTPYWCGGDVHGVCADCPPSWSGGYNVGWADHGWTWLSDGCCEQVIEVAGDLRVDVPYDGTGQDVMASFMEPGSGNPWFIKPDALVSGDDSGADASFAFSPCANTGTMAGYGAWDQDGNGLWDPLDPWGALVDDHGESLGSVEFADQDIEGLEILIPHDQGPLPVFPVVTLAGELRLTAGSFDELLMDAPDAHICLAALRWAVEEPLSVEELAQHRGPHCFEPEELVGRQALAFALEVPGHSPVQLRAWLDRDHDEQLGEPDEATAWPAGTTNGLIEAGDEDLDGLIIELDPS